MDEHPISARLVRRGEAEKEFDREFWRRAGPQARFEAAWEMVLEVYRLRGDNAGAPLFFDLLRCLNAEKTEYLVVGAHAVIYYAEPRYTKTHDVWVNPSPGNAARVHRAPAGPAGCCAA